jgi:hypothetical protein
MIINDIEELFHLLLISFEIVDDIFTWVCFKETLSDWTDNFKSLAIIFMASWLFLCKKIHHLDYGRFIIDLNEILTFWVIKLWAALNDLLGSLEHTLHVRFPFGLKDLLMLWFP